MHDELTERWVTAPEAARLLGVHKDTMRRWGDTGQVPMALTPGKQRRFRIEDIRELIAKRVRTEGE